MRCLVASVARLAFHPGHQTVIKWHRQGFKCSWRWKSSADRVGRPRIDWEIRDLIRRMSHENPTWGVPRIRAELHLLGYKVAESTVAKYRVRIRKPPSQTWKSFLRNHANEIVAIDFFIGPTVHFQYFVRLRCTAPQQETSSSIFDELWAKPDRQANRSGRS